MTDREWVVKILEAYDWNYDISLLNDFRAEVLREAAERAVVDEYIPIEHEKKEAEYNRDQLRAAILGDPCIACAESVDGQPANGACQQCRDEREHLD